VRKLALLLVAGMAMGLDPLSGQSPSLPSQTLLVAEKRGGFLGVVDPTSLKVIAHVPAAPTPHEVATDGRFAYLSTQGGPAITVIDLATLKPVESIDLGAIGIVHGLAVAFGKLYFTSETARTVARYDPATRRIDWLFGGGQGRTHLVVISADGSKVFTTNIGSGTLSIIEQVEPAAGRGGAGRGGAPAPPNWTITAVQAGAGAEGIALSPDEKTVWTANVPARSLAVIDVASKQLVETIPLTTTYSNRLAFTRDGRHVLVTDLRGPEVTVFDAATRKEVKRIPIGAGTEGLLVAPDGRRAFVSSPSLNKVAVIDLQSFAVTGEIPDLAGPDGLSWLAR
jgi:DNA-binding beta-propeller fold protein YncE